ncbi:MAG: integration host factor subunit alpha [Deltaproteobacteria bacterium]|nr:integration host factor subunit alpha [Deltaproteobacteria bacterium]
MAYTKASMIDAICEKIGLPKRESTDVVELLFEMMKETLERGDNLKISGFGSFLIRDKRSRMGRNPQTGESMEITARRVITFKPSQILRDALNED